MPSSIAAGSGTVSVVMTGGGSASALAAREAAQAAQAAAEAAQAAAVAAAAVATSASGDAAASAAAAAASQAAAAASAAAALASEAAVAASAAAAAGSAATATTQAGIATTKAAEAAASAQAAADALTDVESAVTDGLADIAAALSSALTDISTAVTAGVATVSAAAGAYVLEPFTLGLISPDHTSTRTYGTPNPITGSNQTDITCVAYAAMGKKATLIGVGGFGINSGGTIYIGRYSVSGGTTTVLSEFSLAIPAGAFYKSVAAGTLSPVSYASTDRFGYWGGGATTNSKIPVIASGSPGFPFYTHTGHVTTSQATGALVTNSTPQIYFVFQLEDGSYEVTSDISDNQLGKTFYMGRDTTVVQAGSSMTDNSNARFNPMTSGQSGTLSTWSIGANTAGQGRLLLARLTGDNTLDIYFNMPIVTSGAGANTYSVAAGTLPANVPWYEDTVRGYSIPVSGGFGLTYSAASSTVGTPGHELTVPISTGLFGSNTFVFGSGARRYEDRIGIVTPSARNKLEHQNNGVLVDEDFSGSGLPPRFNPNGTWTFGAGYAQPGSTGLANGLELDTKPAANRSVGLIEFTFNAVTDHIYFGLMDATGNYSTLCGVDASTNSWYVYEAWTGGTTAPSSKYQTISPPFSTSLANTTHRYRVTMDREERVWSVKLKDVTTNEPPSEIKVDLTTWTQGADLSLIGMMNGGLYFGAFAGTPKFSRATQYLKDAHPRLLMISDSMFHSRADTSVSMGYALCREVDGGGVLIHVDGTNANSTRILSEQHAECLPTVEIVILNGGTNDTAGTRANLQVSLPQAVRIWQGKGALVALCTVCPTPLDALPYPEINDDIRSVATTYGCVLIEFDKEFTVGGDGVTRDDPAFSTEGGALIDVHWNQLVGHPRAKECVYRALPQLRPKVNRLLTSHAAQMPSATNAVPGQQLRVPDLGGGEGLVFADASGLWRRATNSGTETIATNVNFTWTPLVSAPVVKHTGTLTADRTVTLSTTGAYNGLRARFVRTGSGAFNLSIGGLKNLTTNTWCEVEYDGSAWYAITGVMSL